MKKVFADILNCCCIYRTYFIFDMANLLSNSMVMDMGNVFFVIQCMYFPCDDFVYIFEWANTKTTVIAEFLS